MVPLAISFIITFFMTLGYLLAKAPEDPNDRK